MLDPFDVALERGKQFVNAIKGVVRLLASEVAVITFARFIVVAQKARATDHVGEPVLVGVRRTRKRCRKLPEYKLSEGYFAVGHTPLQQF